MFIINDYLSKLEEFFELRNLSEKSRENYISSLKHYMRWLQANHIIPEEATHQDIRNFIKHLKLSHGLTIQTINLFV